MTSIPEYEEKPEHKDETNFTEDFAEKLTFHTVTGDVDQVQATVGSDTDQAPAFLAAQWLWLADGTELRQRLVDGVARKTRYERLDNEILPGFRLARVAASALYPPDGTRLLRHEP